MWSAIAATSTQLVARCIMRNTGASESFLGSHIGSGWPKNTIGRPDSDEAANPARGIKNSATYRRTWFAWATFACHRGIGGSGGGWWLRRHATRTSIIAKIVIPSDLWRLKALIRGATGSFGIACIHQPSAIMPTTKTAISQCKLAAVAVYRQPVFIKEMPAHRLRGEPANAVYPGGGRKVGTARREPPAPEGLALSPSLHNNRPPPPQSSPTLHPFPTSPRP